jgi:HSP20 family protein
MLTRARWTSDPIDRLTRDMDRLFESMFSPTGRLTPSETPSRWFSTPLNLWEDDTNVYVETEVPGVKMGDIEILATGDELTIKGERQITLPEEAKVLRRERGAGSFERKTSLPVEVDVDRVEATMRDGVLLITLPKVASRRPRKVEVRARPNEA